MYRLLTVCLEPFLVDHGPCVTDNMVPEVISATLVGTLSACPQLPAQRHPCTGSFGVLGLWLGAKALGQYPCAQPMPSFSCAFPFDIIRLGFHGPTIQRSSEASMVSVFSFFYKVLRFFSSFHFLGPTLPCPPASSPTFLGFSLPSEVSPSFLGAYSCRS